MLSSFLIDIVVTNVVLIKKYLGLKESIFNIFKHEGHIWQKKLNYFILYYAKG
jgi:hypothetical protein